MMLTPRTYPETKLFWRIPAVQSCKSLASSSNHDFAWHSGVTRCDSKAVDCAMIKKSAVFLLSNMHITRSSWQMLYFQCLTIRFYRFSLILPKRKKNYISPHFMPLSVWNSWPWLESSHKTSLYWSYVSLNFNEIRVSIFRSWSPNGCSQYHFFSSSRLVSLKSH